MRHLIIGVIAIMTVASCATSEEQIRNERTIETGKELFNKKCSTCHTLNGRIILGPPLNGVIKGNGGKWVERFIRDSDGMIAAGGKKASKVFNQYNKMPMPKISITDKEMNALLSYIQSFD